MGRVLKRLIYNLVPYISWMCVSPYILQVCVCIMVVFPLQRFHLLHAECFFV